MDIERLATGSVARVGVWLPVGTICGFAVFSLAGVVYFPDAVLFVTLLAALGWVAVGFGGSRVSGPFDGAAGVDGRTTGVDGASRGADGDSSGGLALAAATVVYLTVTTVLGWAIVVAFYL